jgi:nascent polypeptide-associated complex subunit beta
VQASIQAKTYVISGPAETKTIQELLPGIIQQLGGDNIQALSKQFSEQMAQGGGMDPALVEEGEEDDDDAVPDLVENFEVGFEGRWEERERNIRLWNRGLTIFPSPYTNTYTQAVST